jgi:hypothetical protein
MAVDAKSNDVDLLHDGSNGGQRVSQNSKDSTIRSLHLYFEVLCSFEAASTMNMGRGEHSQHSDYLELELCHNYTALGV